MMFYLPKLAFIAARSSRIRRALPSRSARKGRSDGVGRDCALERERLTRLKALVGAWTVGNGERDGTRTRDLRRDRPAL